MPATKTKSRKLGRCAVYAEEVLLINVAAKAAGLTVHEFISRRLGNRVRKELREQRIDPDGIARKALNRSAP